MVRGKFATRAALLLTDKRRRFVTGAIMEPHFTIMLKLTANSQGEQMA